MKKLIKLKSSKYGFLLAVLFILILIGCSKDSETLPGTNLRVINTVATSSTFNIYLNDIKLNTAAIPYGSAINYVSNDAGSYSIKFTPESSMENLYSTNISLPENIYNSFYIVGKVGGLSSFMINDNPTINDATKAYVRLVNACPDGGAVNLVKTGGSELTNNKAFKTASGFIGVDAVTSSFDIVDTSNKNIKASITDQNLVAGNFYDVIYSGFNTPSNQTDKPLNVKLLKLN
jgi:hypothetical protein